MLAWKSVVATTFGSEPAVRFPAGPGVENLLEIYRTVRELEQDAVRAEFEGRQYSYLKQAVAEAVNQALKPSVVR